MKAPLTLRQHECFEFIAAYMRENKCAPLLKQVAAHMGYRSHGIPMRHVEALVAKGWLTRTRAGVRAIALAEAA